jgi:hypothetical protein
MVHRLFEKLREVVKINTNPTNSKESLSLKTDKFQSGSSANLRKETGE